MKLYVGGEYTLLHGFKLVQARIEKIEIHDNGKSLITVKIANVPGWFPWFFGFSTTMSGESFVEKLDEAVSFVKERQENARKWRTADSVEVRYRGEREI